MFRIAKNAAAALALTGLVLSQPALAVRSSESLPAPGAKVMGAARVGTPVSKSEDVTGVPALGLIIAGVVVLATVLIIANDNKDKNKSPG
jgi:hypothetical protein